MCLKRMIRAAILLAIAIPTLASTALAGAPSSDEVNRLTIQHQLDYDAPLIQASWIGTHNSFNNSEDGYAIPNHTADMIKQLNKGFRALSYDTYYYNDKVRLCHGLCGVTDTSLNSALFDLKEWLQHHPDEVVMIVIQDGFDDSSDRGRAARVIDDYSDFIFSPNTYHGASTGDCDNIPINTLTKRDVLEAGKQIVLVTPEDVDVNEEHHCAHETCFIAPHNPTDIECVRWRDHVWRVPVATFRAQPPGINAHANPDKGLDALMLVYEDRSPFGDAIPYCAQFYVPNSTAYAVCVVDYAGTDPHHLSGSEIRKSLERRTNIVGLDFGVYENRHSGAIWSWGASQPDNWGGVEDCARHKAGVWSDENCNQWHPYACLSMLDGEWLITSTTGPWSQGDAACRDEFGPEYAFAAPVNAQLNKALRDSATSSSVPQLWINATDSETEGDWIVKQHTATEEVWGVDANDSIHTRDADGHWTQTNGLLTHVSVGADGTVWGVNTHDYIYYRDRDTDSWVKVSGLLKQISVGSAHHIWGVNANNQVYRRGQGAWIRDHSISLEYISAGADGSVWGIQNQKVAYRDQGTGQWVFVNGNMVQLSVGADGVVWAVNGNDQIYYRGESDWVNVPGLLKHVSVAADGTVWGVNANNRIYRREGDGWVGFDDVSLVQISTDGF